MIVCEWRAGEGDRYHAVKDLFEASYFVDEAAWWDVFETYCGTNIREDGVLIAWCGRTSSASIHVIPENRKEAEWIREAYDYAWHERYAQNDYHTWRDNA